jgi:hypothetical protein
MSKTVDLKSLGVIQDMKELKGSKGKTSSNFDTHYAKEKLKWQKEKISIRDNPNISKEQKVAAYDTIDRKLNKEKENANIRQQEAAIEKNSFLGKFSNKLESGARKLATQRVISRRVFKKNNMQVHIPERKVESVLNDPNRFFKNELSQTKRSLFFE